ncbi:MAG: Gx transporter family protein [Deferribacterales bacterium]|nr:Gx transporter family protein [Deferribacterales bacterium]
MQFHSKTVLTGLLVALCIVLGFIENFIPNPIFIVRLGLANIPIILALFIFEDKRYVIYIALLKGLLLPILSGNFFIRLIIGLPSTLMAAFFMLIIYKIFYKSVTAISVAAVGGYVHIVVQLFVIKLFFIKYLDIYKILPYFSIIGIITGILTGILSLYTIKNINLRG